MFRVPLPRSTNVQTELVSASVSLILGSRWLTVKALNTISQVVVFRYRNRQCAKDNNVWNAQFTPRCIAPRFRIRLHVHGEMGLIHQCKA